MDSSLWPQECEEWDVAPTPFRLYICTVQATIAHSRDSQRVVYRVKTCEIITFFFSSSFEIGRGDQHSVVSFSYYNPKESLEGLLDVVVVWCVRFSCLIDMDPQRM